MAKDTWKSCLHGVGVWLDTAGRHVTPTPAPDRHIHRPDRHRRPHRLSNKQTKQKETINMCHIEAFNNDLRDGQTYRSMSMHKHWVASDPFHRGGQQQQRDASTTSRQQY
eukprot:gene16959-19386_t